MKIVLPRRRARSDIDMVPMINFAFLLLIFFLMVGRFGPQDLFDVTPPRAAGASSESDANAGSLLVRADGALALGRTRVEPSELHLRVTAWRQSHPEEPLQVKADAGADAAHLVELLQQLRAAGVTEVRLLTRPAR